MIICQYGDQSETELFHMLSYASRKVVRSPSEPLLMRFSAVDIFYGWYSFPLYTASVKILVENLSSFLLFWISNLSQIRKKKETTMRLEIIFHLYLYLKRHIVWIATNGVTQWLSHETYAHNWIVPSTPSPDVKIKTIDNIR